MDSRSLTLHCSGPEAALLLPADDLVLPQGGIHAWFGPIGPHATDIAQLEALLDPDELRRADRFRFAHDRERYIVGHGLLRRVLSHYIGTSPQEIAFARGAHGKPFLPGQGIQFNFSDTKDGILVAVGRGLELGADVETMQRTVDHLAVSTHYFTPEEQEDILRSSDTKRRFLELWTRKEAVLKASGVGIMEDLKVLRVDPALVSLTIRHAEFLRMAHDQYHVGTWSLGEDHIISLATPEAPEQVRFFALEP
jgi:4'-phosphopantetheinyl transferase